MKMNWRDTSGWRMVAICSSLGLLGLNVILGIITMDSQSLAPVQQRDVGAAIALPLIGGFCLFFFPIINTKAQTAILLTAKSSNSPLRFARVYAHKISQLPERIIIPCGIAGSAIALSYLTYEGLVYIPSLSVTDNLRRSVLVVEAIYMWFSISLVVTSVYQVTKIVTRYIERHLKIELFHVEELVPLAQTVFWNTAFLATSLAFSPLFWLGAEMPFADLVLVMGVFTTIIVLMFYPLVRIRSIIVKKKNLALARIKDAIKEVVHNNDKSNRRLTDDKERLNEINNLVNVRDEIAQTKEWPLNSHVSIRFVMIFLLPPLSWVAASLVDWVLKQALL